MALNCFDVILSILMSVLEIQLIVDPKKTNDNVYVSYNL